MKAAVMYTGSETPEYTDVADPTIQNDNEVLVTVKAVAVKHFDKGRARGTHYSSDGAKENGRIPGGDGVCILENGTRIYGMGTSGMMAEKATIYKDRIVPIPDELDDATAAALPNAVIGAAMGLKFKAAIKAGDVVLINGATGFTGCVAVQIAKHYGAKKVIVTGRNERALTELLSLGADEVVNTSQSDEQFVAQLKNIYNNTPIDIVIDYLWGHSAELIFACIKGDGAFTNKIRYVSVGSVTGDLIQLSAAVLRSADITLTGSGLGSWTKEQVKQLFSDILPEMFRLAADGKLKVQTVTYKLENIAELWHADMGGSKRPVIVI